jgi:hypothetical protein
MLVMTTVLAAGSATFVASTAGAATPQLTSCGQKPHKKCYPPKKPHSNVPGTKVKGKKTKYCVSGYMPNGAVTVTNGTIDKKTIMTDASGAGCTTITLGPKCNPIVATGLDPSGASVSTSAFVCVLGEKFTNNSPLPFTGAVVIPTAIAGIVALAVGLTLTLLGRRRRTGVA